jgi:N-acetylmuramoyl-L-alanine amidase
LFGSTESIIGNGYGSDTGLYFAAERYIAGNKEEIWRGFDGFAAGEPKGWHVFSHIPDGSSAFVHLFASCQNGQVTTLNAPLALSPAVDLACIDEDLTVDGKKTVVVWRGHGDTFVGYRASASGGLSWKTSSIRGIINSRGEGLDTYGNRLWRNGTWHPLTEFVDAAKWINLRCMDINDSGMILAMADKVNGGEAGKNMAVMLLPVEVVELSPKTKDEEGNDIVGSERPSTGRSLTPFVELNPVADRIAHRELKVKIGEALKGKTVTWTLDAVPDATPATIRGRWNHSTTHADRFETSAAYGANGFTRLSQESGRTTVADDGFTAIRVNVPPVGFNQVRIRIQIESVASSIDLIDMEVPGVVVIDPGHGGTANEAGSSWNNATSPSGALEKAMALDYGLALRDALRAVRTTERLNLRIFMTREADINRPGTFRAAKARDNGADVINIIHFNASDANTARGTLEVYRTTNNVFPQQDTILAEGIITRMVTAMTPFDAGANHRARVVYESAVASDGNNGNTADYCPVRTSYIEVEFIDFGAQTTDRGNDAVDILLNTGPNAAAVKTAVGNAMRDGILHDLRNHQPQP